MNYLTQPMLYGLLFISFLSCSDRRFILKSWENGKPKVVATEVPAGWYFEHYYPNGQLEKEGLAIDSIWEKDWRHYYENGTLQSLIHYREGKKFGEAHYYYPNGRLSGVCLACDLIVAPRLSKKTHAKKMCQIKLHAGLVPHRRSGARKDRGVLIFSANPASLRA